MKTNAQDDERRRFHRVGFHADALLNISTGTIRVEILDISLAGALIKADPAMTLEEGSPGSLIVRLSEEVQIKMKGVILLHGDGNYAFRRILKEPENDHRTEFLTKSGSFKYCAGTLRSESGYRARSNLDRPG